MTDLTLEEMLAAEHAGWTALCESRGGSSTPRAVICLRTISSRWGPKSRMTSGFRRHPNECGVEAP